MKANLPKLFFFSAFVFLLLPKNSSAQTGKVVINEYMPWTSNGCGTTAEFVELYNFGPGPVDISCYTLTTGIYSVTIPSGTAVQPGKFFVLAGQDLIAGSCSNIDSTSTGVHANLNWNTCNCTNVPIPTSGDGMMKDGGNSNTPLVLFDPSLNIVDAVVRNTPTEAVQTITSATLSGGCASHTFNIGTMNPTYEVLGMSAGRGNSFARTIDGDCNWLKDPQQSAGASNNRSGRTADITYTLNMVSPTSCGWPGSGSANIYAQYSNYATIFPMSYVLAQDLNNDGTFDLSDQYNTYTDYDAPYIEVDSLLTGHFKTTVFSKNGCDLKSFEFTIIACNPGTLPVKLVYFKGHYGENGSHQLEWLMQDVQNLQSVVVEKEEGTGRFVPERVFVNGQDRGDKSYTATVPASSSERRYRLKITQKNGQSFYSSLVNIADNTKSGNAYLWPNPVADQLHVERKEAKAEKALYNISNQSGTVVAKGFVEWGQGETGAVISVPPSLQPGLYQLGVYTAGQPISLRFVKH